MFKKLTGNNQVKDILRRFVANKRVPNSLMFAGDEGVGKRQFALELAKALICTDPTDGEACEVCPPCRRAEIFTFPKSDDKDAHKRVIWSDHPDVGTIIPYNRNILVDAIRHIESEANFQPYEAQSRFFIIDDADKMNDSASNALLKTLEEPPASSHIFLITSRPDSMLPTIRSRCQTLRFAPVSTDEIERYLMEERAFTHDEARLPARLSRGSIGRAVTIDVKKFRTRRDRMLSIVQNVIDTGDVAALLRTSEELNDAKNKDSFEENLDILQSLIHDVWTIKISGDSSRVVNTDVSGELATFAANSGRTNFLSWLDQIEIMRQNFAVNINRKVATDALFVSMAGV